MSVCVFAFAETIVLNWLVMSGWATSVEALRQSRWENNDAVSHS
jgi:hypothetical protein